MAGDAVTIMAEPSDSEAATALMTALHDELSERYREFPPRPATLIDPTAIFVIARRAGTSVGCGAVIFHGTGVGEIKRVYVTPEARGAGIGRRILRELMEAARQTGYHTVLLETGIRQPDAIALYESEGFTRIPCYGEYADSPVSVCFQKGVTR